MANRKVFDGNVVTMIATSDVKVRDVVVFEDSIGIAQVEGKADDSITVDTVGVYEMDCVDADEVAVGNILYYKTSAKKVTVDSNSGANVRAGVAWSVKASGTAGTVDVKIG